MCGIFSIVSQERFSAPEVVGSALKALAHRGPDASGVTTADGCILGHTRLSIIDLVHGSQPMTSADGRYTISFNGELYNFRDLRSDLQRAGHQFGTSSDTEVILAAYAAQGEACLDQFRGMFAFAIWDSHERKLFAARDLFGEKPLYFASAPGGLFLLSSEIKALIATGLIEPKIDMSSIDAFLAFGYIPPDRTIYSNIQTLPPGHYLYWKNGVFSKSCYWQPLLEHRPISLPDAIERTRELLRQAVRRQMVADVPVGAFLSGGLDSSTIVALMQMQSARPVKTFSVGFGDYINELPYARAVANKYATEHYEIDVGAPDVAAMLLRMAEVYDEPFADTSNIPTYLISEFASKHVKVVLSGDGGDELFGGYTWSYPMLVKSEQLPESMIRWIIFRSMSRVMGHRWKSLALYSAGAGLSARWSDMWTRQVMQNTHLKKDQRERLWGDRASEMEPYDPGGYFPPTCIQGANRGFYFDLTSYLPGDILVKVDRAAMSHGLETRAPFLDRDLAEFALSLPVSLKVNESNTKILLREACSGYWPRELQGRPKQGFGAPVGVWLNMPAVREMIEHVLSSGSLLKALLPGIDAKDAKGRDYKTWILLTLGLWLERHSGASGIMGQL